MENKNYTIVNKIFVCKTKYFVHIVFDTMVLKWDNCGWFGNKRNSQVGHHFSNEDNRLPKSKKMQCGWQMIKHHAKRLNLVKCT
jgi:hypothetical protein